MDKLKGKVALITGASSGIGQETALLFAREGARVVLLATRKGQLDRMAEEIRTFGGECLVTPADVREADQVEAAVQAALYAFGQLDILVNSAGLGIFKEIVDTSIEEYDLQFDVNVKGLFLVSKAVIPIMKEKKSGLIINIGSMAGVVSGSRTAVTYNSTKWALVGMSRCMSIELRPDNIRVTLLNPGTTDTNFRPGGGEHADWMQASDVAEAALLAATIKPLVSIHEMTMSATSHGW